MSPKKGEEFLASRVILSAVCYHSVTISVTVPLGNITLGNKLLNQFPTQVLVIYSYFKKDAFLVTNINSLFYIKTWKCFTNFSRQVSTRPKILRKQSLYTGFTADSQSKWRTFAATCFAIRHPIQVGSGAQPQYQTRTEVSYMYTEEPGMTTHNLFSAEDNHVWLCTSLPTCVFVACAELGMTMALPLNGEAGIKLACGSKLHHNYITQPGCCSTFKVSLSFSFSLSLSHTHTHTHTHTNAGHTQYKHDNARVT